jgi:hypothetical protein
VGSGLAKGAYNSQVTLYTREPAPGRTIRVREGEIAGDLQLVDFARVYVAP